ncbi:hypothetical protein BC628DRAFT_342868 [Trametes gibbosa]|nr:hypothetical protein BC628DRAFT_342868 [Trametes gibbosa]
MRLRSPTLAVFSIQLTSVSASRVAALALALPGQLPEHDLDESKHPGTPLNNARGESRWKGGARLPAEFQGDALRKLPGLHMARQIPVNSTLRPSEPAEFGLRALHAFPRAPVDFYYCVLYSRSVVCTSITMPASHAHLGAFIRPLITSPWQSSQHQLSSRVAIHIRCLSSPLKDLITVNGRSNRGAARWVPVGRG